MPEVSHHSHHDALHLHDEVESLASKVLSVLASKASLSDHAVDGEILDKFCAAILQRSATIDAGALAELRANGLSISIILDGYIPEAARALGQRWADDELSFAEVTIGVARLQAILRDLGRLWTMDGAADPKAPNIMIVVPLDEFHTLGGMTAASQFRRLGLSVCLCLGLPEDEILQKLGTRRFDMIALSASASAKLDSLHNLVKNVRQASAWAAPIVLGGTVLERGKDVKALTGVDFATSDPKEALRLCGLKTALAALARPEAD
ncbi:methanogenic corrinoid protein MtbC1 [Rhodovulum iodosum]|uniref:Methanogenic corrinoid protein MtbC1 n=1 Tax=Rhodovulum iodosum TaxID=68291 RepID=A0ABV3XR10_9RHOB|nr:cobalamin-dependent protein [Rhodovulum robiginosum]RSK32927.1 hypothetical protein EJA01_11440 [Rhodovulum robiginosum]